MLGLGEEYTSMGIGQDHVSDPVLWVLKRDTSSLLWPVWLDEVVIGAVLVSMEELVLLVLLVMVDVMLVGGRGKKVLVIEQEEKKVSCCCCCCCCCQ